jgi:hypothetical protein
MKGETMMQQRIAIFLCLPLLCLAIWTLSPSAHAAGDVPPAPQAVDVDEAAVPDEDTAADPAQDLPGALVVVDDPSTGEAPLEPLETVEPLGADCGGILNPCGIVNNRTNRWLQVNRDSDSHLYCKIPAHPHYGWVAPGRNSNQNPPDFKDTDCFRSLECSVFYGGLWHPPGDWVRIRNSVFIYNLGC